MSSEESSFELLQREAEDEQLFEHQSLSPEEIVSELDKYIVSQHDAKRAVAIALRNRWRRLRVAKEMRDEITPKNIIMIGPTGVGKTEISRRLAKLAKAPFVKVEASKFTEVGYVGRDVESIIRELVEISYRLVRADEESKNREQAEMRAEDQLVDLLLPHGGEKPNKPHALDDEALQSDQLTRERVRSSLRAGKLEQWMVEIEIDRQMTTHLEIFAPPGMAEMEGQLKDMFQNIIPKQRERKRLPVSEARKVLLQEALESSLDHDELTKRAVARAEQTGIVFIDEVDKICGRDSSNKGPDVSREGVQRDLLPLVEGTSVPTKFGTVKTDHILFIASGAFHLVRPSDLMPEFQGRFPIRVELKSLTADEFVRILKEPRNALTKQYQALLRTEEVDIRFTDDGISELARLTSEVNSRTEDIGARRLHTLLEKVLEDISFRAADFVGAEVVIDQRFVRDKLESVVEDVDLSRFIL